MDQARSQHWGHPFATLDGCLEVRVNTEECSCVRFQSQVERQATSAVLSNLYVVADISHVHIPVLIFAPDEIRAPTTLASAKVDVGDRLMSERRP